MFVRIDGLALTHCLYDSEIGHTVDDFIFVLSTRLIVWEDKVAGKKLLKNITAEWNVSIILGHMTLKS